MDKKGSQPILKLDSVSLEIEGVRLLQNISFDLDAGEVMALVGPNGAGKSTLLKAIAGEIPLSSGSVHFHGQNLSAWKSQKLARHLAVLPQRSLLNFPFTCREVVELARIPHNTGLRRDKEIIDQVLDYMDASYLADRLYPQLSGGEQQRIQLCRVLAQIWEQGEYPRLLILDEPTSNFDLAHQQLLVRLVRELSGRDIAVLIVVHDLNMATSCADTIAVLRCGQLYACGSAQEVLTETSIEEVFGVSARFIEDAQTAERFLRLGSLSQPGVER